MAWFVAAAASAALAYLVAPSSPAPETASPANTQRPPLADSGERERLAALPVRPPIPPAQGQLFGPQSWDRAPQPEQRPRAAAKPAAPPVPYRVAGQVTDEGGMRVVLAKGERVFFVREGDALEGGYRVDAIRPDAVTLTYLPLGVQERLVVSGGVLELESAPVAHMRFEGPQQVRAGSPFTVALKVTSSSPVSAAPLELSFDAKVLQPVSVRPGKLFADASFTYRVSPKGSIVVGASGTAKEAMDADFLLLTFKPIGTGAAELRLASAAVHGAAGAPVALQPPPAFRAAIVR